MAWTPGVAFADTAAACHDRASARRIGACRSNPCRDCASSPVCRIRSARPGTEAGSTSPSSPPTRRRSSSASSIRRDGARPSRDRAARIHPRGLARLSARGPARPALRLSRARPLRAGERPPLQSEQAADRPLRQGAAGRHPLARRAFRLPRRLRARRHHARPPRLRLRHAEMRRGRHRHDLGRRPPAASMPGPRPIIYEAHVKGMTAARQDIPEHHPRHLRRPRRSARHRPSGDARRHRHRADADPGLLRRPQPGREEARQLLGLQHRQLFLARAALHLAGRRHPRVHQCW